MLTLWQEKEKGQLENGLTPPNVFWDLTFFTCINKKQVPLYKKAF